MNGLIRCAGCGKLVSRGSEEMVFADGRFYCMDCVEIELYKCDRCGEYHSVHDIGKVNTISGVERWCMDCIDAHAFTSDFSGECFSDDDFIAEDVEGQAWEHEEARDNAVYCEICGEWHRHGRYLEHYDMTVCDGCLERDFIKCDDCGEYFSPEDIHSTANGGHACDHCLEQYYMFCGHCNHWVYASNYDAERGMCEDCIERLEDASDRPLYPNAVRLNYHSVMRPELKWFGECRPSWNGVMQGIGLEIEVDAPTEGMVLDMQATLNDICSIMGDRVFFEYDCSLSNADGKGFEMITQPHTIDEFYNVPWEECFAKIMEHGWSAHDAGTCGLHVHFSRAMFGADEDTQNENIAKLMQFFELYYDDIVKVSRRKVEDNGEVYWARKGGKIGKKSLIAKSKAKSSSHYDAVNVSPRDTVEIRIMRGNTLSWTHLSQTHLQT